MKQPKIEAQIAEDPPNPEEKGKSDFIKSSIPWSRLIVFIYEDVQDSTSGSNESCVCVYV